MTEGEEPMANDLLLRIDRKLAGSGSVAAIYDEQDALDFYAEIGLVEHALADPSLLVPARSPQAPQQAAVKAPCPSPSLQSTASPARAVWITRSGVTTFPLPDATAATSQS
jgi:hypothetical protein